MSSGIYKIINKINGKYYVGRSSNLTKRLTKHKRLLKTNTHFNDHLQNAWNKYGEQNFEFVIAERMSGPKALIDTEQRHLDIAKSNPCECYNQMFTAETIEVTEEMKRKISATLKGVPHFPMRKETSKLLGDINRGKRLTIEHRKKIKLANTGRKFPNRAKESAFYKLQNSFTNELFEGTRTDFCHQFQIPSSRISDLLYGRRPRVRGWTLLTTSCISDTLSHTPL